MPEGLASHLKHRNRFFLEIQDNSEIATINTAWPFLSSNVQGGQEEGVIFSPPYTLACFLFF